MNRLWLICPFLYAGLIWLIWSQWGVFAVFWANNMALVVGYWAESAERERALGVQR